MASSVNDTLLKLLLIGDSGVGKSCMTVRYVDETFRANTIQTIGIDFKLKTLEIDGKRIRLQIWDTAGQERFHTITSAYYRGALGIMLVYDITREDSFDNITKWLSDIEKHASTDVEKILVGNKYDLESNRVVPCEVGEQMAKSQGITFIETSAKTDHNIDEAFDILVKEILKKKVISHEDSFTDLQQPRQGNVKTCSC